MYHFEVDVIDKWPKLKMIINSSQGVRSLEAPYDTALTQFEVHVRNQLQQTVNNIIQRRKRK